MPGPEERFTTLVGRVRRRRAERMGATADDPVGRWLAQQPARLIVEVRSEAGFDRMKHVLRIASALGGLGFRFEVEPLFGEVADPDPWGLRPYWLITLPMSRGEVGALGHDMAYELTELDGVDDAVLEAVLPRVLPPGRVPAPGEIPLASKFPPGSSDLPWIERDWSLRKTTVDVAHRAGLSGKGVRIAHPDTGWGRHPELDLDRYDLEHDVNLVPGEGPSSAEDPLDDGFALFPGHGTGTGSVLISGHTAGDVFGVAPRATVIDQRCMASVIFVNSASVARAVFHACENDAHVISMSLGGMPARALERVVKKAVYEHDIIMCAAAGNKVFFTVFPASYPEVVCVAASTSSDRPYLDSSHGPAVDVSAPGARVWAADFDRDDKPIVIAGAGTSYATPHVAGAAALWLEKHGRDTLRARYNGKASLSEVFRHLLRTTSHDPGRFPDAVDRHDLSDLRPREWDTSEFGPGVLDTAKLLAAPLPSVEEVRPVPVEKRTETMSREAILDVITSRAMPPDRAAEIALVTESGEKRFTSEVLQRLADARAGISAALRGALGG